MSDMRGSPLAFLSDLRARRRVEVEKVFEDWESEGVRLEPLLRREEQEEAVEVNVRERKDWMSGKIIVRIELCGVAIVAVVGALRIEVDVGWWSSR